MAITIAMVIKNVCLSRRWKGELVIFRTGIQTPASFTHLVASGVPYLISTPEVECYTNVDVALHSIELSQERRLSLDPTLWIKLK
jgi:hypothetical protein